jgi:hypothetical protein
MPLDRSGCLPNPVARQNFIGTTIAVTISGMSMARIADRVIVRFMHERLCMQKNRSLEITAENTGKTKEKL